MGRTRITTNDLLEALRVYGKAEAKRPAGPGWYLLEELAAQSKPPCSVAAVKYRIKMAQQRGVTVEIAHGTVVDEDGRIKRTGYYRLRNGKP